MCRTCLHRYLHVGTCVQVRVDGDNSFLGHQYLGSHWKSLEVRQVLFFLLFPLPPELRVTRAGTQHSRQERPCVVALPLSMPVCRCRVVVLIPALSFHTYLHRSDIRGRLPPIQLRLPRLYALPEFTPPAYNMSKAGVKFPGWDLAGNLAVNRKPQAEHVFSASRRNYIRGYCRITN